ncbi:MAG: ABC transporter substrate-binding protein [Candidatus Binatia bacterium]
MKQLVRFAAFPCLLLGTFGAPPFVAAAQQAGVQGYHVTSSHDEIVSRAKQEGKLRILTTMDDADIKANTAAFKKKYPFLDVQAQQSRGTDSAQRLLLEIKSGTAKEWDVVLVSADFYSQYHPYLWKVDVLEMAKKGVLQIPPPMIDPRHKNVLASFSYFQVTAYNSKLIPANLVPKIWEDLLRPEFKGRKFAVDIRPKDVAALVPAWGVERTLDFARKIAAQQPIWVRGGSRVMPSIISGEIAMMMGNNYGSVREAQRKDPRGVLQYAILEPVPVRFGNAQAILSSARHPYAGLLWLEWLAFPEAQRIIDDTEPYSSSVYVRGGVVEQELRGKSLSVVDWEHYPRMEEWQSKIVEAYGFPKADAK